MDGETHSPEEILKAAEEAQRALELQQEQDMSKTLHKREDLIHTERMAADKQKEVGAAHHKAKAGIKAVKDRGSKVAPEMEEAEKKLGALHEQATAATEGAFKEIGDIEARSDVNEELYNQAKEEDGRRESAKKIKLNSERKIMEQTAAIEEAKKYMTEYGLIQRDLKEASDKINRERKEYQSYASQGADALKNVSADIKSLPEKQKYKIATELNIDYSKFVNAESNHVFQPNLVAWSKQLDMGLKKAGIFDFKIKSALEKVKRWLDQYIPADAERYAQHQALEAEYTVATRQGESRTNALLDQMEEKKLFNLYNFIKDDKQLKVWLSEMSRKDSDRMRNR